MIPTLTFIFASWGHFIGTCVLLVLVAVIVAMFGPVVSVRVGDHEL